MSYFRNVENDGKWLPGGTYSFEYWQVIDGIHDEYVGSGWYECGGFDGSEYGEYPEGHGPFLGPYTCYHSAGGAPYSAIQWNDYVSTIDNNAHLEMYELNEDGETWDYVFPSCFTDIADTGSGGFPTSGEWRTVTLTVAEDTPPGTYNIVWRRERYIETWYFITPPATSRYNITLLAEETLTIAVGRVHLVSPEDDTTDVHFKDILTAIVVDLGESVVSSVQLYLNNAKVYDGGPRGTKPYLQWMVGIYCVPNTGYDWYVTATIDGVEHQSETWTFTTAGVEDLHPSFYYATPWNEPTPAYDIYFGTISGDLDLIVEGWTEPEWEWNIDYPIDYNTDYYWNINNGPEYTFTTTPLYAPPWQTKYLRLVAAANNKIFYEDV